MHDEYIKKLELENEKLYRERTQLYNLIAIVSKTNNLQISFDSIVGVVTPELIVNYTLRTYPLIKKPASYNEHWAVVDISGKQYNFIYQDKPYSNFEQELILKLFRAIWDDYNAKTQNRNTFNLLLDIIGNSYTS